jgi:peroxiredoxin
MAKTQEYYRAIILIVLIFGGLLILFSVGEEESGLSPVSQERLEIGRPAPDFSFPDLFGNRLTLSDHRGRVVLVNIWATWCPPCVKEMPSMQALYQELRREDFEILAISVDVMGSKAVEPFMKKNKLTFPALLDPNNAATLSYRTTGVPESFIVDKEGILVRKIIGPIDWVSPAVISFIRELIDQ